MNKVKRAWFSLPGKFRKPVVLFVGLCFVLASLLFGWLPGVGGIPLFIIGVTILATEYEWASRFRDFCLSKLKKLGEWYHHNKILGTLIGFIGLVIFATTGFVVYSKAL